MKISTLTDKSRIEYSLIPALLETYLLSLHKETKNQEEALAILNREFRKYLGNKPNLYRRSDRIANKILNYTKLQKFDTRKAILALTEWLRALLDAGALELESGTEYWDLLEQIGEIIQSGYRDIENFDRIDASAIGHVQKIHKIAQDEGYFL